MNALAGDDSPRTHLLVNALAGGGLVRPLTKARAVTYEKLVAMLDDECQPMLTELLLQNIVNKRTPAHYIYNACYLFCVNMNTRFSEIEGVIGRIPDDGPENGDSEKLVQDVMPIIMGYYKPSEEYVPGLYNVFPPIPDLMLHEVVQGSLLMHAYMRLTEDAFNTAKKKIETRGFAWTLSAFMRILPTPDSQNYEPSEIGGRSILFKGKAYSKDSDAALYNLYYMDMHGALTIAIHPDDLVEGKVQNTTVPDNLVMVRTGLLGSCSRGKIQKDYAVFTKICSRDINKLALKTEQMGLGCDIVPPGYSVNDMQLVSDPTFWTGIVDCVEGLKYEIKKDVYLSNVIAKLSALASNSGRMALFVMLACHETDNIAIQQQGLQANVQAFMRLPRTIKVMTAYRYKPPSNFNIYKTIQKSSLIRQINPEIPKWGEVKWLVDSITTAEESRSQARSKKRKADMDANDPVPDTDDVDMSDVFNTESSISDGTHHEGGATVFSPTPAMNYGLSAALLFVTFVASVIGTAS